MNKGNKLLLGILAFVVVCIVGYALFSETITITGTATAQGNFEITGSCEPGVPAEFVNTIKTKYDSDYKEGGYKNDSCSFNGNEATISVELEYPTAERWFTIKFTNTGSIPALLKESSLKESELCLAEGCTNFLESTEEQQRIVGLFPNNNNYMLAFQIGDGNIITADSITNEQLQEFLSENQEQMLKPGNSVYIGVQSRFKSILGFEQPGNLEYSHKVVYEYSIMQITE